jgi:hypothetical protein
MQPLYPSVKQEFIGDLTNYYVATHLGYGDEQPAKRRKIDESFSRHLLIDNLLEIFQRVCEFSFDEKSPRAHIYSALEIALDRSLEDDALLDDIVELLQCPILLTKLKNPVLLASGHTCELGAIQNWIKDRDVEVTNPFTREPLGLFREDRLTSLFLQAIVAKSLDAFPESDGARNTIEALKASGFFVEAPMMWCRLLSVTMPHNHFYVRQKAPNHFVIEIRLPLNDAKQKGVQRISFFINERGYYQAVSDRSMGLHEGYETLADLCTAKAGLFTPLMEAKRIEIEKFSGKDEILRRYLGQDADPIEKRSIDLLIKQLQCSYSQNDFRALSRKTVAKIFRPGISLTYVPSFTTFASKSDKEIFVKKLCFSGGRLWELSWVKVEKCKTTGQILIFLNETSPTTLMELNETIPMHQELLRECRGLAKEIDSGIVERLYYRSGEFDLSASAVYDPAAKLVNEPSEHAYYDLSSDDDFQ